MPLAAVAGRVARAFEQLGQGDFARAQMHRRALGNSREHAIASGVRPVSSADRDGLRTDFSPFKPGQPCFGFTSGAASRPSRVAVSRIMARSVGCSERCAASAKSPEHAVNRMRSLSPDIS